MRAFHTLIVASATAHAGGLVLSCLSGCGSTAADVQCVCDAALLAGPLLLCLVYMWSIATAKPAVQPAQGLKHKQRQSGLYSPLSSETIVICGI